jgi:hypothetical protein
LEKDAVDLLNNSTDLLKFIFSTDRILKEQVNKYEEIIKTNKSVIQEIEKLDKYKILL